MSAAITQFEAIEGMTGRISAEIWSQILDRQGRNGQAGDLFEIGTYKGRTAILLAHHLQPGEHLHLIDIEPYLLTDEFRAFEGRYSLHIGDSSSARTLLPDYRSLQGRVRFLHSDASHTFANVVNDIMLAHELLSPDGVLAVDDYSNSHYPQVPAATCYALFMHTPDLAPFLIADNKIYLCRRARQLQMRVFARDELFPAVGREIPLFLSKTDLDPRFDCYSLIAKSGPGGSEIYGRQLFGGIVARDSLTPPPAPSELQAIATDIGEAVAGCGRRLFSSGRRLIDVVRRRRSPK